MYFSYLIGVFLLISPITAQSIKADNSPNCYVDGISENEWGTVKYIPEKINDTEINKTIFSRTYRNIKSVGKCDTYFCVKLDETQNLLTIVPSPNFSEIDGNGDFERTDGAANVVSRANFECSIGSRSLTFKINVTDTNNHDPSFSHRSYKYVLPMPMSPKNSITNFGDQIIVTDVDFSNKDIKFSSNFDGLSFKTTLGENGSYSYILEMEFKAVEKLTSSKTFTLTATDTGTPPRSKTAEITFSVDEELSEPPSFTKPSYLYKYDEKTKLISPNDGQGAMLEDSRSGLTCSVQEGDYSTSFHVEINGKDVKLSVTDTFDYNKIAKQLVQVTIECSFKNIGTSTADAIISFPKSTVGFEKKKYTAQYEINGDTHEVKMTDVIKLTGSLPDRVIAVEEDLKDYFEVKAVGDGWTLNKLKNLDGESLKNTEINIIITLSDKDNTLDEAFILLVLPNGEEGVDFIQSFFSGDYKFDDNGEGTMEAITITLNNKNFDIIGCGLDESDYSSYFKPSCEKKDGSIKLSESGEALPKDKQMNGTVPLSMWLKIKLGAIERKLKTTILLHLSYAASVNSDCYVDGITEDDWTNQITISDVIDDISEANQIIFQKKYKNIKSVGKCDKYFCITLNETQMLLTIVPSENLSEIDGNGEYEKTEKTTVPVTSTIDFVCSTGKRSLKFEITVRDTNNHDPSFSQPSYKYVLPMPMSPKNSITNFGDQIIVRDVDFSNQDIKFSSSDFDGLSFKTTPGGKGSYSYILEMEFKAVKKLASSKTFTLTATDTGTPPRSKTAEITFSVDEELSEPPSFTKPSYLYKYDEKTKLISPTDGQGAMLENSRSGLTCSIQKGDYSSFFKVDAVDGKKVEITLSKTFDEQTIAQHLVQVTIECFVDKNVGTSTADVILTFSNSMVGFAKKKYTAQYEINGDTHEVKMTDVIKLTGSLPDSVIAVEDDYKGFFEVKSTKDGWTLNKIKNLDDESLENTEINIIIMLYNKDEKLDVAFILLVLPNGEEGVYFTQSFFTADYKFDDNDAGTMDEIPITLNNKNLVIDDCGLEENEYSTFFEVTCDDVDELKLKKKSDIKHDLLRDVTVPLTMWMNIQLGNIKRQIETAILLNLKKAGGTTTTTSSTTSTSTTESPPVEGSDDCSHTGWIIALIVSLLLFIVYVIVTVTYYIRRIRNRTETEIPHPRTPTNGALSKKRTSDKFKDVSTRRPTGFIRYNPDQDRSSLDSENGDDRNEVEENTNRNRFTNEPEDKFRKISESSNRRRSIGFVIPPPPPEP